MFLTKHFVLIILVFLIFSNIKYIYTANLKFFEQGINVASYAKENVFYALYICSVFGPAGKSCCKSCLRVQKLFSVFLQTDGTSFSHI